MNDRDTACFSCALPDCDDESPECPLAGSPDGMSWTDVWSAPVNVDGVEHRSVARAAREIGIRLQLVRYRLEKQGMSVQEALSRPVLCRRSVGVIVGGVAYQSMRHCADALGVSYDALGHRRRKGQAAADAAYALVNEKRGLKT